MSKANIALAKLAIGIVSAGAVAGIAGRFSQASAQAAASSPAARVTERLLHSMGGFFLAPIHR